MNDIVMARFNAATRQLFCFVLMAGVFSLHLAIASLILSVLGVPAMAVIGFIIFPLSILAWNVSKKIVNRMLLFLEGH